MANVKLALGTWFEVDRDALEPCSLDTHVDLDAASLLHPRSPAIYNI